MKWRIYHRVTPEPAGGDLPPVRQKQASSGRHAASSRSMGNGEEEPRAGGVQEKPAASSVEHAACSMQHERNMHHGAGGVQKSMHAICSKHATSSERCSMMYLRKVSQ